MAWNKPESKSLANEQVKASGLNAGAPIAFDTSRAGRAYRDGWDMQRAYREGMQKVTWVFRCIDAIAGNQARLPIILRADNSPNGTVIEEDNQILEILNSRSNEGEDSFIFRYRLSSQLLMSTRGVFIEKVRGRNGELIALHLLPPQHTSPIPDPRKFVAGYEVDMPSGIKIRVKPEDVIWIRRPHPLDPYLSLTPMEAAGVAIEIENLAKIYNRNFLVNDGRPGGLIVVRGEMDEDDKDELRSRFRGNINRAGGTTVIASEDGVDFVDTGASPRDAAYSSMRQITKEEILAAFGVPESVIGNASGRTFSNAGEEIKVFWMETMLPHLEPIARALDVLHPRYYIDFDTTDVPALILAKQEREQHLLQEFGSGLISANEYRLNTGRGRVTSDLMDSMLANPNLAPIGNTEKPTVVPEPGAAAPGPQTVMTSAVQAGALPGVEMAPPQGQQAPAVEPGMGFTPPEEVPPVETTTAPVPGGALSEDRGELMTKAAFIPFDDIDIKAVQTSERWTEILDLRLQKMFENQQSLVLEKALGEKNKKLLESGKMTAGAIFNMQAWNTKMNAEARPILAAIIKDAAQNSTTLFPDASEQIQEKELDEYLDSQISRLQLVNQTTRDELTAAILVAMAMENEEERSALLKTALLAVFANLMKDRRRIIAEHEAQTAYNAGLYLVGKKNDETSLQKRWITRRDAKVRAAHASLDGKSVELNNSFIEEGTVLRFPGDPLAPPSLTINCRCRLRIDKK